jgi:hypothetical protein
MHNDSMPDRDDIAKILPKSMKDRRTLSVLGVYLVVMVVFVVTVLFFQHRRRLERENAWQSATARIEDVRPVVASQIDSQVGSAMLYQVEVLADYNLNGAVQRRWIRIERLPGPSPDKSQISRWKGKQFVVRWRASQPNDVVAELN